MNSTIQGSNKKKKKNVLLTITDVSARRHSEVLRMLQYQNYLSTAGRVKIKLEVFWFLFFVFFKICYYSLIDFGTPVIYSVGFLSLYTV